MNQVAVPHTFLIVPCGSTESRTTCINRFVRATKQHMRHDDFAAALREFVETAVKASTNITVVAGKVLVKLVVTTSKAAREFAQELQSFLQSRVYKFVEVRVRR